MTKVKTEITDKEWLDLAWKHFQQHAQQRILYFNYFVVFSTILTTGLVTTFQANFQGRFLGVGLGVIQAFLSYVFWKIDDRNRFITKHSESIIREIETTNTNKYNLFTREETLTLEQFESDKSKWFWDRQITHGKSYKIIFLSFFFIGLIGSVVSLTSNFLKDKKLELVEKQEVKATIKLNLEDLNSLKKTIKQQGAEINLMSNKIDTLTTKVYNNKVAHILCDRVTKNNN